MNEQFRVQSVDGGKTELFLANVHSLRAFAIVLIVGGHVAGTLRLVQTTPGLSLLSDLFDDGTIIFVFVAGYLFAHLRNRFSYLPYLKRKFANVILPYIVVATPAVIFAIASHGLSTPPYPQLEGHSLLYQSLWYYSEGGAHMNYALWFIPMISLYYLAAPVFIAITETPFVYVSIIPLFIVSAMLKRPPFPNLDLLHHAIYVLPAYLTGMFCAQFGRNALAPLDRHAPIAWGAAAVTWVLPFAVSSHHGNYVESGYFTFERGPIDWLFVQKFFLAVFLTSALKHIPPAAHRCLKPLADTSFAIFFVHLYWLVLLLHFAKSYIRPDALVCLMLTALLLALSFMTAKALNWALPACSSYLIGYEGPRKNRSCETQRGAQSAFS